MRPTHVDLPEGDDKFVVTYSDIRTYLRCRRSWYWSYVRDVRPPELEYGPLALGSRVHKALEMRYSLGEDPLAVHQELADEALRGLTEREAPDWEFERLYEDIIVGRNSLSAFVEWLHSSGEDDNLDVEDVECTIEAELTPGIFLRSKLDVLYRDVSTGFLWINDWKTDGGGPWTTKETLERSWQHTVYQIALGLSRPDEVVGGAMYTTLRKAKNPAKVRGPMVERWKVPSSRKSRPAKLAALQAITTDMRALYQEMIESGSVHPLGYPTPDTDCKWCEYRHACALVDEDEGAANSYIEATYVVGRKHARYESS